MNKESVDLAKAFTFAFDDKEWPRKFLFGAAAVLFAPALVGLLALLGYGRVVFRAALEGRDELPSWDRAGDYLADGMRGIVIFFAYTAPVWAAAVGTSIVTLAVGALPGGVPSWLGYCCSAPFGLVVALFVLLVMPVALARHYAEGRMDAAFEFQKIIDFLRENLSLYLPVFAAAAASCAVVTTLLAAGMGLAVVLIGIPILAGGAFLGFLAWLAHVHALAQMWRLAHPAPDAPSSGEEGSRENAASLDDPPPPDDFSDLPEA